MLNGVIARIISEKGFGFVRDPQTGIEYFFHRSTLKSGYWDSLREGSKLSFEPEDPPPAKGPRVMNAWVE